MCVRNRSQSDTGGAVVRVPRPAGRVRGADPAHEQPHRVMEHAHPGHAASSRLLEARQRLPLNKSRRLLHTRKRNRDHTAGPIVSRVCNRHGEPAGERVASPTSLDELQDLRA